jgi:hypothetical protein
MGWQAMRLLYRKGAAGCDESRRPGGIRPGGRLPPLREADECVHRYVIFPGAFAVDSRTTNSGSMAISEG